MTLTQHLKRKQNKVHFIVLHFATVLLCLKPPESKYTACTRCVLDPPMLMRGALGNMVKTNHWRMEQKWKTGRLKPRQLKHTEGIFTFWAFNTWVYSMSDTLPFTKTLSFSVIDLSEKYLSIPSPIHSTLAEKQTSRVALWKELMEWIITTCKVYLLQQAFIFFNKLLHLQSHSRDERDCVE